MHKVASTALVIAGIIHLAGCFWWQCVHGFDQPQNVFTGVAMIIIGRWLASQEPKDTD